MENQLHHEKQYKFHSLKLVKKEQIAKNIFAIEFEIPHNLKDNFYFDAGQYVGLRYEFNGNMIINDYSMTNAPAENKIALGIKINSSESSTQFLFDNYAVGDYLEVSEPKGRFTIATKPHEFRTILGFASGIGITPILSHFKHLLYSEPRTRLFLFYGNKNRENIAFREELENLRIEYPDRLQVFYFLSQERVGDSFVEGRLDEKKLKLIINQVLHLDDTDEESTIWDAVDEVLICGKGDMIKSIANACYENGILKRNIHFELFEAYNDDIFPIEVSHPIIQNVSIEFVYNGEVYTTIQNDNSGKILQDLTAKKFPVPFSCKSGICGSCQCKLIEGKVEMLENEYLTEKEEDNGYILPCMSFALSDYIKLDFDTI